MAADKLHDSGIVLMMSGIGTNAKCRPHQATSEFGGKAESICAQCGYFVF
jgi:hypothetical protein